MPVGRRLDNGQKRDIRFGGDDPDASGLALLNFEWVKRHVG